MLKQLAEKVRVNYFLNDQWLNLTSHYEDDGKLTEQLICLIDETNECIFCIALKTFSDSESGWESQPYMLIDSQYNTFIITVPKFGPLTSEDIKKAIKYIIRENFWLVFNVKVDGVHI
jgi:hypothetical protein